MTQANNVAIESSQINSSGVLQVAGGGTGLSTVGTSGYFLQSNGSTLQYTAVAGVSPGGSNTYVQYNNSGAFGGSANFVFNGTQVGILNSSPSYSLQVGSATADTRSVFWPNSAYAIGVGNGASGFAGWIGGSGTADNMVFSSSGGSERMRIDSSGNLGIGTSSPNQRVDALGYVQARGTTSSYFGYILYDTTNSRIHGTIQYVPGSTPAMQIGTNVAGTGIGFYTGNSGTQIQIDSSGNLQLYGGSILNNSGRAMLKQTGGTLQVVSAYSTTTVSTTNTYSGAVSTTITATITPSNTSSKILIQASVECYGNNATGANLAIFRNGTNLTAGGQNFLTRSYPLNSQLAINVPVLYIDSPASTSAQTYTIYLWSTASGASATTGQDNTQQWIVLTEIAQ